jgi:putative transposase
MKKSPFTEDRITAILKHADAGVKIWQLARKDGISDATLYNWKARYGGLDVSQLRR